jgi:hypothetical protein
VNHLPNQRRKPYWRLTAMAVLSAALMTLGQSGSAQDEARLAAFRKDPRYAALYDDGKAFLALPVARKEAMRKLHLDIQGLPSAERERVLGGLARYADWLDGLPKDERKAVVGAKDKTARMRKIKEVREKHWIARQPGAVRRHLEKLPKSKPAPADASAAVVGLLVGTPQHMRVIVASSAAVADFTDFRAETIRRIKKGHSLAEREWEVATKHWHELTDPKRPTMPVTAAEFGKGVETFVKEFLQPWLSKDEQERLANAEGRWPQYPVTLVELADKHPMALPQKKGPNAFGALPVEVQNKILNQLYPKKDKDKADKSKQQANEYFHKGGMKDVDARLSAIPLKNAPASVKFACAVATYAHAKSVRLPHELWASRPKEMSRPMQVFLDDKGSFMGQLTREERDQLSAAEGKWPEYPLKIRELARRYGYRPPWQSLPDIGDKSDIWDSYRGKSAGEPVSAK